MSEHEHDKAHNPGEPQFGDEHGGEHNPGEPTFGEEHDEGQADDADEAAENAEGHS